MCSSVIQCSAGFIQDVLINVCIWHYNLACSECSCNPGHFQMSDPGSSSGNVERTAWIRRWWIRVPSRGTHFHSSNISSVFSRASIRQSIMNGPAHSQLIFQMFMMTSSNGNMFRVTGPLCGEFPAQRPVTRSFDIFFDLRLNKPLSK